MSQKVNTRPYQICTRCVMDTTDPDIVFDENGVCNHCHTYDQNIKRNLLSDDEGKRKIEKIVRKIKYTGKNKECDCIIGVSGGVDSSFVAYKVKELGLRPLAVHLDNGWDSELAVKNIEQILNRQKIPLHTHVIDWEEFKDLQLAFLKASTPDSEIPSDHAIVSLMYQMAEKIGVRYIVSGCNFRTETHIPRTWSHGHSDWKYIRSVHERFGKTRLKTFPHRNLYNLYRHRMFFKWIDILNYVDYVKTEAIKLLEEDSGWEYYGGKHYESIYTRFYQGYLLPKKFGYDKRRSHFSSLICSGEMTREEALEKMKGEPYPLEMQKNDKAYVIKRFGLTNKEFDEIMNLPKKSYWDYPSYRKFYESSIYKSTRAIYRLFKLKNKWH